MISTGKARAIWFSHVQWIIREMMPLHLFTGAALERRCVRWAHHAYPVMPEHRTDGRARRRKSSASGRRFGSARTGRDRWASVRLDVTLTGRDADADAAIRATDGRTGASTADREFCWFDIPLFR
ncbi:hypothetical protein ACFHYO_05755 [Paracoccus panacisoli]|uniref:Uncharacterized protein n=1 Tax=Paracoccus panacisoli TaxID=1510163 RepID=A0ABV6T2Z3_9RHOB